MEDDEGWVEPFSEGEGSVRSLGAMVLQFKDTYEYSGRCGGSVRAESFLGFRSDGKSD